MRFASKRFVRFIFKKINLRIAITGIFVFLIFIILYNEFFTYAIHTLMWKDLKCSIKNRAHCVRLLLVADPQLLGENQSSMIEIWDNDRYLYTTFITAVAHFDPDVIIFLGDLMDEGSVASDEQYEHYLERFRSIYEQYTADTVQMIYVPGDNDIGGEFFDFITQHKMDRFKQRLSHNQPDFINMTNIAFYKINRLTGEYPSKQHYFVSNKLRVGVSHIPLLYAPSKFLFTIMDNLVPSIFFTAHLHTPLILSSLYLAPYERKIIEVNTLMNEVYNVRLDSGNLFEFIVPTCSYRMGVEHMGFGAAVINLDQHLMDYTIFWLPSRLNCLYLYLYASFIAICTLIITIIPQIYYLFRKLRLKLVTVNEHQP